jgi:8-oxo-dGTP pyrophosphatase MutT (NUDIX family)
MLYLIPAPAHRMILRIADGVRRRWWFMRRPRLSGCRVLAFDAEGRVLLVRHSYGNGAWMPPGGGLQKGEDPLGAAQRELREETGCTLHWAVHIELAEELLHGAGNAVHVIAGDTFDPPLADGREIVEARFFACHELPEPMPRLFRARLPDWITAATAARPADLALPPPSPPPAPTG